MKQITQIKEYAYGLLLSVFVLTATLVSAQTVLIDPAGDGGFENGATFGDNGWIVSNATNNPWALGTAFGASAPFSNRAAYPSLDGGVTATYNNATPCINYFYRDITVPAGEDVILLTFDWSQNGENNWDIWQVFYAPTSVTPVGVNTHPGSGAANVPVALAGATYLGNGFDFNIAVGTVAPVQAIIQLPASLAGTTFRLIFSWKSDTSLGDNPGAVIDNIELTSQAAVPLCGTYTIDNTLPTAGFNFNSFTDAILALNLNGICGSLTFDVTAGQTFNETPPAIVASGNSSQPIIFQKNGGGNNPIVIGTGTGATNESVITLSGVNYITFNGIDVGVSNNQMEFGYRIRNASATVSSNNNTIQFCSVTLDRSVTASAGVMVTSSTTGGGVTPTATTGSNSNNVIDNVTVTNAYFGINVISGSTAWPGQNNVVTNCTIGAPYVGIPTGDIGGGTGTTFGIQFSAQNNGIISGNTVQNIATSGINRGIYTLTAGGTTEVSGNVVRGVRNTSPTSTSTQRGIELGTATTAGTIMRCFNNMVSDITAAHSTTATATRVVTGIYLTTGSANVTYETDFNSVSINSGSVTCSSVCLDIISATSIHRVRSNSLTNFTGAQAGVAKHWAIRSAGATLGAAGSVSNYNNLYVSNTTNGFVGLTGTTDRATIADWTANITSPAGTDANSIGVDPVYVDPALDLHATGVGLVGAAIPGGVAHVTVDIDGATRLDPSSIGADEYVPATCFPPVNLAATNVTATGVDISWDLNGADSYNWEIRSSGAPGSGPAGLEDSGNTAGNSASSSTLPDQTTMAVYVQSVCPGPITSTWSAAVAFTTPCLPATVPWTDSFEAATINNAQPLTCYGKEIITGTLTNTWRTQIAPIRNGIAARTGTDYMVHTWSANSWLFSPGFEMQTGETYLFRFWYLQTDPIAGVTLNVGAGNAQTAAAMTPLGSIVDVVNTTYNQGSYTFTAPADGVYYFGLQCVVPTASPWYTYTDDWSVDLLDCSAPIVDVIYTDDCPGQEYNVTLDIDGDQTDYDVYIFDADPAPAGPFCNEAQTTPGFPSDLACEAAICLLDAFCCDTTWDGVCAGAAAIDPACTNCLAPTGGPGGNWVLVGNFPGQGLADMGDFPHGSVQSFLVVHPDNPLCDVQLDNVTRPFCPPANDDCSAVTPVVLTAGVPQVFNGTTLGATGTTDGPFSANPTVWEAITVNGVCNNITLEFCGNVPAYGNVWINLATNCPVTTFTAAGTFNNTACGDGNYTVEHINLPAGTYWIPVMGFSAGLNTAGPYTITATVEDCPPPPTAFCEPGLSASPGLALNNTLPPAVSTINVGPQPGGTFIQDLNVVLDVTHTFVGDLTVTLTSPCGTSVVLQAAQCAGNDNFEAQYDDEAEDNFAAWCPVRFGSVIPQNPLSAFDDEPIVGLWTLTVADNVGGDVGTLDQWCLVPTLTTCVDPVLATSNITDTTIDVDILSVPCVPGGTYSTFDISWESSPGCVSPDCGSATGVTFPYTITGLLPSTFYDILVTANCTAGGTSGFVGTGVSTLACPVSETCNYTLTLNRTAGTGFSGALVEVNNGWSVTSYTLPGNLSTISYPILACPGVQLSVSLNNGGNGGVDNTHRVRLTNSGNVNVLDVLGPNEGQLIVLPDPCPDCASPINLTLGQTAADFVEVSWSNGGDPVTDYLVELNDFTFGFPIPVDFVVTPSSSTSFTFPSSPGTDFEICVTSNCTNQGVSLPTCISFLAPTCNAADQCQYQINAADVGSNGWGEYGITVLIDGGAQTIPYSLLSGSSGTFDFYVCGGSTIEVLADASGPGGGGEGPFIGCNSNTTQFSGGAIPTNGTLFQWTTCQFATEFAPITINAAGVYRFTSSIATDYLTLTNGSNVIVANGSVTPLIVTIPTTGSYRVHFNTNAACGTASTCRAAAGQRLITCSEPSVSLILNPNTDNYAQFSAPAGSFCNWTDGQTLYSGSTCPTCFDISGNTVSNVTGTSAEFNWFSANGPGTQATIYVGAPGFDYTVPAEVLFSSSVAVTVVGNNEYVFGGLSPLTSYEAVIVEECNAPSGDFSLPSSTMAFTTLSLCPEPSSLSAVPGGSTAQVTFSSFYAGADYTLTIALTSAPTTILQTLTGTAAIGPNTVPVSGLSFSTSYQYCVSIVCGVDGSAGPVCGNFTTGAFENDLCGGALPISCGNVYTGTTVGASTTGQLTTTCGTTAGAGGVWYVMNNTQGIVTITTCAAVGYDTKLFVYSGSCAAPVCVTGNDDATCTFSGLRSTVQFYAQATETYYVVVSGFSSNQGAFEMTVSCVECVTPASNQNCAAAETLTSQPYGVDCTPTVGDLACGGPISTVPTCAGTAGLDLWYAVTATNTTHVMLLTPGTALSVGVALHQPCGVSLGCLATVNGVVQLNGLSIGTTYYLQVFTTFANAGTFNICVTDPPPPAPNDLCEGALALTPGIATCGPTQPFNSIDFSTTNSSVPAPPCGAYGGLDQWYSVVVPDAGTITINTNAGSITNTALAAYSGDCGNLTLIGCAAGGGVGNLAQLEVSATPGSTIYVRAWAEGGGIIGTFSVCAIAPPTNDICSAPANVNIVAETCFNQVGNVNFATSANIPTIPFSSCATNGGGRDVWYQFTAETSQMFITAQGLAGGFDMVVEAWDGCGGTLLGCANNTGTNAPVPPFCNQAQPGPGFPSNPACEAAICAGDSFCCTNTWDGICAGAAATNPACVGCLSTTPAGAGLSEELTLTGLTPGNTYLLRFYHNALTPPAGNGLFTFCVRHTWQAELIPSQCGVLNYISNDVLSAVYPGGPYTFSGPLRNPLIHVPQDFEWKFVNTNTLNEYTYIRGTANYNCALHWPEDALGNQMEYNQTYDVFVRIKVNGIWGDYSSSCTIGLIPAPAATQLRPNYTPTNPQGQPYSLCNSLSANAIQWADRYEFELDNGVDPVILAESNFYHIPLSAFAGIQMNTIYQVRVRCRVDGVWGPYGVALPITIGLPANTSIWISHCNTVRPAAGAGSNVAAYNVCSASEYVFRFQHTSEPERIVVRPSYTCPFNTVVPALTPGQTYTVSVRVTQGGVQGDYSTSCPITIAGPQAEGLAGAAASKISVEDITAAIFPNPNAGNQVSINMSNIADEHQMVTVDVYDIYGKRVHIEEFANSGSELNSVITFGQKLAPGMYLMNIYLNDVQVMAEKLVVQ